MLIFKRRRGEERSDELDEARFFVGPEVVAVDFASFFDGEGGEIGMIFDPENFFDEIGEVIGFEGDDAAIGEVVTDAGGGGGDDWPVHGEVFEDAGGEIEFGEWGEAIGDDAEVRGADGVGDFGLGFGAVVVDVVGDAELGGEGEEGIGEGGMSAVEIEVEIGDVGEEEGDGLDEEIDAVAVDDGAVVDDAKGGSRWGRGRIGGEAIGIKEVRFWGIHEDVDFAWGSGARVEEVLEGEIGGEDEVGEADAGAFEEAEGTDEPVVGGELIDAHHEFGHGVMEIEDDFGAGEFGEEGSEDEDIGHIVDMHEVIFFAEDAFAEEVGASGDELGVLF